MGRGKKGQNRDQLKVMMWITHTHMLQLNRHKCGPRGTFNDHKPGRLNTNQL